MNLSTLVIGLVILAAFVAIVANEVKKRRSGGCCRGRGRCSNAGACGGASPRPPRRKI